MEAKKEVKTDNPKEINDIRIGMNSRVRNVIKYCNFVLNEKKMDELRFSAVGGAIGKLVDAVEVLKIMNPGLFQTNKIATVSYQTVDNQGKIVNQRLYPKLEVVLSLTESKEKTEGTQSKLAEEERVKLLELLNSKKLEDEGEAGDKPRARGRGRGRGRGGRGPRGGPRGPRVDGDREDKAETKGPRGPRTGSPRGGFRGFRGGNRGRGGFRGNRDGNRGPRGAPRGGPRGNRGRGF